MDESRAKIPRTRSMAQLYKPWPKLQTCAVRADGRQGQGSDTLLQQVRDDLLTEREPQYQHYCRDTAER